MNEIKKKSSEVATIPWHMDERPTPVSPSATAMEYIPIAGHKASTDAWAALRDLLEKDDGSKRVSASDAAKRLGVSPQQLYRWLAGPTNMHIATAGKVAAALEANLEIVAIPWEELKVQTEFHSFSLCRMESRPVSRHFTLKLAKSVSPTVQYPRPKARPATTQPSLRLDYIDENP